MRLALSTLNELTVAVLEVAKTYVSDVATTVTTTYITLLRD